MAHGTVRDQPESIANCRTPQQRARARRIHRRLLIRPHSRTRKSGEAGAKTRAAVDNLRLPQSNL
jgi:hypothetical protein